MKTVLRRAEIIEKLKKILSVSTIEIVRETILDNSRFSRCYVLLIKYGTTYQVVNLTLRYGWIQLEFCECFVSILPAVRYYLSEIGVQSTCMYEEFVVADDKLV